MIAVAEPKPSKYDVTLYFQVPQETWSEKECAKAASAFHYDGLGTKSSIRGLQPYRRKGPVRYNGGCLRAGEWYHGEVFSLPKLVCGYVWEHIPTWGWRIRRENGK